MATNKAKPARVSQPIVSIQPLVSPIITRRSLASISAIAERASNMLLDVRESMLAPHPRKRSPVYSTAQVAALCRIDKGRVTYLTTKGELPPGTGHGTGKIREFTLAEARQYVAAEGQFTPRPEGCKGKKIAIGNFKGGVSKTTTAMTLAQGLTLFGRKVLLIDLDPQASLSALNGVLADSEVEESQTVLPLIYGEQADLRYAIQETYWDGIDLIPASAALFSAEFYLPFKQSKDKSFRFWNILNQGI
jgi:chromosome partitioning protein